MMQGRSYFQLIAYTLLFILLSCQSSSDQFLIKPDSFNQKLQQSDVVLLDVRTSEEFEQGHLKGALNINFMDASFSNKIAALDPSKTYLVYCVYCRSGSRSHSAAKMLRKHGSKNVYELEGGIMQWIKEEYPVVKD